MADPASVIEQLFESKLITKREFDAARHVLNLEAILMQGRSLAAEATLQVLIDEADKAELESGWHILQRALHPKKKTTIERFLGNLELQKRLRNVLQRLATAADCMMTELTGSKGTA